MAIMKEDIKNFTGNLIVGLADKIVPIVEPLANTYKDRKHLNEMDGIKNEVGGIKNEVVRIDDEMKSIEERSSSETESEIRKSRLVDNATIILSEPLSSEDLQFLKDEIEVDYIADECIVENKNISINAFERTERVYFDEDSVQPVLEFLKEHDIRYKDVIYK